MNIEGYDDYKLASPPEAPEGECLYCGQSTHKTFCSTGCRIAEMND